MEKVQQYARLILQGLLFGAAGALLVVLVQNIISDDGALQRSKEKVLFQNSVQAAQSYKRRNFDYVGVCSDTALPDEIRCVETVDTFKLEMKNPDGGYWCADSSGFNGQLPYSTGADSLCR